MTSTDVNEYLKEISRSEFTAKDFRTWGGTVLAATALRAFEPCETKKQAKKNLLRAIEAVAQRLGNTPSICRKCYIHPEIINSYMDGTLLGTFSKRAEEAMKEPGELNDDEEAVLKFLQKRLEAERRNRRSTLVEKLEASLSHRKRKKSVLKQKRAKKAA